MSTTRTAPPSREQQRSLFKQASNGETIEQRDEGREGEANDPELVVPQHQKQHILCLRIPIMQRRVFSRWRQEQANREWRQYVDRRLPTYSVDGYKDISHRKQTLHEYGVDRARKQGWGDALRQKKASLRKKWRLSEWRDIRLGSRGRRYR